jgi:WD40 repeat protein/tRNA A-37 threonylcarbamoyl transferase component Bud32
MDRSPISPPSPSEPALSEREQRLDQTIALYLEAVHAGEAPDRADFLARHPDLAADLRCFFADEDRLKGAASSLFPRDPHNGNRSSKPTFESGHLDREIKAGTEFGDFELLDEIATGGMGVVFKAKHKKLNRIVALKTIRLSALKPGADAIQRFRIEAEAVARLDHPQIVPIYEMGEHGGCPFLSLKLISGGDLERHVPRLRDNPRAIAQLIRDVARAVHYAHLRGILHRDLKPSNILLDEHDVPYVTDFGLAKCVDRDSGLTQTGLILGTPAYMAPEQVTGHHAEVTTAADVYGLGAVLYKLLTGRPPFRADSVYETLRQVREQEPVSPRICVPRVDRDLEAICLLSLEKDPRRRYPSAEAMADDLERWLAGEPIAARPIGSMRRAWRWCARNRVVAGLSASVAALLVAVTAVATVSAFRQHTLAEKATASAKREHDARLLVDESAREIRWRLVGMNVENGNRMIDVGDLTGALPWFAEALRLDRDEPGGAATHRLRLGTILNQCPVIDRIFTHEKTILWAEFDHSGRRLATASADHTARIWDVATGLAISPPLAHDGPVNWVEFQGDDSRLLSGSDDGTIRIWNVTDGKPSGGRWLTHASPVRLARFSPDGKRIVSAGSNRTVWLWDAERGTSVGSIQRLNADILCMAYSPDGTVVAVGAGDSYASLWKVSEQGIGFISRLLLKGTVGDVCFSPDGSRLLIASHDGTARVWDMKSRKAVTPEMKHSGWVFHAEFSPDGKRVVTASNDGTGRVWDAGTGQPITPSSGAISHAIAVREACFSPDGTRIATAGFNGTARVWDAKTGAPLTPPLYHGGSLVRARFTSDGLHVLTVSSDSIARLWNVATVGRSAITVEFASGVNQAVFDPRGERFATACGNGTAQLWDATTGRPVTPAMSHERGVHRVAFSAGGRLLATGSFDGTARIWNARTGEPVSGPLRHNDTVIWVAFSPDDSRLATASADGTARIWDIATGRPAAPPLKHGGEVFQVVYSPDGRWLASASKDGTARVWDAATGSPVTAPLHHDSEVSCVAFHPGGERIVTACSDYSLAERTAQQWEIATGQPFGPPMKHSDGVLWAAYSPDGTRVATASEDMTARIWDAMTGVPVTPPCRHRHHVNAVEWSPDGRRLATCSDDGSARLWDATTGEPLSAPFPHHDQSRVNFASFRPDGRAILTSGLDGTARIWDLLHEDRPVDALILEAQVRAGRRIDETGGEVPLSSDELLSVWRRLHDKEATREVTERPAGSSAE